MDSVSDEAEYLSTCNVCFIKFDLDEFRPKVLPCSHTFCFRCLQVFTVISRSSITSELQFQIYLLVFNLLLLMLPTISTSYVIGNSF